MAKPRVSVIIGAHNAAPFLGRTLASALGQTFRDFELLVADDGSTDATPEILAACADPRLRVLSPGKIGRSRALNLALAEARGEFAAVLDADDIALPDRLERQVALFDADPDLTVAGSSCWFVDEADRTTGFYAVPESHACILWLMLFHNPFVHSASMFRLHAARALRLEYDTALEPSEDYGFLTTLAWHGKAANDERPLVRYRVHERQLSQTRQRVQLENALRVHRANLARLGHLDGPPELAREYLWGLPVPAQPGHAPLLRFYLELLAQVEARPHVRPGELAFLRAHLENDLAAALAANP